MKKLTDEELRALPEGDQTVYRIVLLRIGNPDPIYKFDGESRLNVTVFTRPKPRKNEAKSFKLISPVAYNWCEYDTENDIQPTGAGGHAFVAEDWQMEVFKC